MEEGHPPRPQVRYREREEVMRLGGNADTWVWPEVGLNEPWDLIVVYPGPERVSVVHADQAASESLFGAWRAGGGEESMGVE